MTPRSTFTEHCAAQAFLRQKHEVFLRSLRLTRTTAAASLVALMNSLGVLIDLTHATEQAQEQIIEASSPLKHRIHLAHSDRMYVEI